ncbi:MAG: FkbM family methyltransferase, partial [Hyphococcus sp.]
QRALERLAAKGLEIASFLDVGAARGAWSLTAQKYWPRARYHLLEAKDVWREDLEKLAAKDRTVSFTLKAATDAPGAIYFPKGGDAYGGAAFKDPSARDNLVEAPATSIDHEIRELDLQPPYAVKLDTHGTEVDILNGAENALAQTHLICIETYNFIGQKRFPEMLAHLQEKGFRVADLAEPLFRESDAALWQLDFYLMRADHPIFTDYRFTDAP